jgi:peptidoglycan/LPS O-acetylase OafA/YrhL
VKLYEIERLRAVAALMVVMTHTAPFLSGVFSLPRTGVDLFFVISPSAAEPRRGG